MKYLLISLILCATTLGANETQPVDIINDIIVNQSVITEKVDDFPNITDNINDLIVTKEGDKTDKILNEAFKYLGTKYVYGASGPNAFDCSGFVRYVISKSINITLPRISTDIANFNDNKLDYSELQRGDLVFFDTLNKGKISHVGIYIGDNEFIHAASGSKTRKVTISSFSTYYKNKFRWGIRIV